MGLILLDFFPPLVAEPIFRTSNQIILGRKTKIVAPEEKCIGLQNYTFSARTSATQRFTHPVATFNLTSHLIF